MVLHQGYNKYGKDVKMWHFIIKNIRYIIKENFDSMSWIF